MEDTSPCLQAPQPISSYPASSFEKSASTLDQGGGIDDLTPCSLEPQLVSSYSACFFEKQSESASTLEVGEREEEEEGEILKTAGWIL